MPSIKILQSLNIAGTISANNITVNTVSALSSVSIPEVTALQNASGNWDTAYTTVTSESGNWSLGETLSSSGGHIGGDLRIQGDLVVNYLSALSGSSFVNTVFTTTSSLCVNSLLNDGPAFFVGANGTGDIASFYDTDSNVEVLHIGGSNGSFPNVGIKVSDPTKTLTVSGEISGSGDVWFGSNIYSNNVNINTLYAAKTVTDDAVTQVTNNSAYWNTAYSQITSGNLSSVNDGFTVQSSLSTPSFSANTGIFNTSLSTNSVTSTYVYTLVDNQMTSVNEAITSRNTQITVITATGTTVWNKPSNAKTIQFIVLGGGGSGQGGGMWDGVTAVIAAAGGGGGGMNDVTFPATSLPASLDVVIGTGGASVSGRSVSGGPINGSAGLPTVLSASGVTYVYAGAGQGGGTANNGGVYNGNNGSTTTTLAGFNMRGGAGGGRGGSLTSGGVAQNGTNGGEGMAGALLGGTVGSGSNTTNGSAGSAGSVIGTIVGLTVSSGGGGGGTSAFATGIGGAGGAGGGWGTGGGGGGAGKGGGGASGPGSSGFAVIIAHF